MLANFSDNYQLLYEIHAWARRTYRPTPCHSE